MNIVAAILYAVAASVLIALGLAFQNGALTQHSAIIALAGGALTGIGGWFLGRKHRSPLTRPRGWQWLPVALFAWFCFRAFLWLVFREKDQLRVLSPNNLGDLSLHITFINYLANGAPFWPDSPIFSAGKLTYAVGPDLFNSLLTLVGVDTVRGLVWAGLIGAILAGFALWRWGGAFGMMGFLCNGGLLGFACFVTAPGEPILQDYAGNMAFDWPWKSLPLALLVTQRGFLFALPAGLLLLSSWRDRFFGGGDGWRLPWFGELLLYAAMPIFHVHTFIALSFLLAAFFIAHVASRKKIAALVAAAFVPATLLVWLAVGMFKANAQPMWGDMSAFENPPPRPPTEVLGWEPGWMVNEPQPRFDAWEKIAAPFAALAPFESHGRFVFFWLFNFGILPILAAAATLILLRATLRRTIPRRWIWAAVAAFIVITPLLGLWTSYQRDSFSKLLLGDGETDLTRNITVALLALAALIGGVVLRVRRVADHGAHIALLAFAGLFILDAILATAHGYAGGVPLLRANAIPLLAATGIFIWLLLRLARGWHTPLWPAAFVFPALFLFFVCCNVKFAPWAWDNTKLMLWSYVITLPFLRDLVLARWPLWKSSVAMMLLFFSGFIGLLGGLNSTHHGYKIATLTELDDIAAATRDIPITEPFAAAPVHNHPLLLTGRKLVLGYTGHVDSHGIHFSEQYGKLDALMNGALEWRIHAAELGVRYLFFGPREQEQWPRSRQPWREGATRIWEEKASALYDLDTPPLPLAE